jgi:hypothetical protein
MRRNSRRRCQRENVNASKLSSATKNRREVKKKGREKQKASEGLKRSGRNVVSYRGRGVLRYPKHIPNLKSIKLDRIQNFNLI